MRQVIALVAAVAALAAGGCASVPTGGPVRAGSAERHAAAGGETVIRPIPAPPVRGGSPDVIVRGFMRALASFENNHAAARQYLVPEKRGTWRPAPEVTVYSGSKEVLRGELPAKAVECVVDLSGDVDAVIDKAGRYIPTDTGLSRQFRLRKVGEEWRIADPPTELLLTRRDLDRAYRGLNLFYYEPQGKKLTPDPVFLPWNRPPDLARSLVDALLNGPTSWLRPAVRSAFPEGTRLVGDTPIIGDVITVNLSREAAAAGPQALSAMSTQLVWTLLQIEGWQRLRLRIAGRPVTVPGVSGPLQSREAWREQDPSQLLSPWAYAVSDGRLWQVGGDELVEIPGTSTLGRQDLRDPAVSLDQRQVAVISGDGTKLMVGALTGEGGLAVRLRGTGFTRPSWDWNSNVWVAQRSGTGSKITVVRGRGSVPVAAPGLTDRPVLALRISWDGVRAAAIVGPPDRARVVIGRVLWRGGEPEIQDPREVAGDGSAHALTWYSADRLVVLSRSPDGTMELNFVGIDGTTTAPIGNAPGDMESVTAAGPQAPLLVGLADGQIVSTTDMLTWSPVAQRAAPTYPTYPG